MKILISAFAPFDGRKTNASAEVLELLNMDNLTKIILPVTYNESFQILEKEIERIHPQMVICLGEAINREYITVERIAINCMDSSIPDQAGVKYQGTPIKRGEDGIFSTFDLSKIDKKNISYSAGTYVCNNLFYNLMSYTTCKNLSIKAGFIHIPSLTIYKNYSNVAKELLAIINKI
ncbi:MAG: hypothetical protein WCR33_01045 [Bacilli bacterium]